jgi:hypothetical protein
MSAPNHRWKFTFARGLDYYQRPVAVRRVICSKCGQYKLQAPAVNPPCDPRIRPCPTKS